MSVRTRAREVETVLLDFMSVRTRAREVETVLPKVVEQKADYQRSGDVASEHNGTRIRLKRLPQLLNDPEFVKTIEGTESYKRNGYTWFWTGTVGTNLSGYYEINPQGKTLDAMFTFISKEFDSKVHAVPFNKRAYFWKGHQPLSVVVGGSGVYFERLNVPGLARLDSAAPVVVVEQDQAAKVAASGVVVPTERFKATKALLRKL